MNNSTAEASLRTSLEAFHTSCNDKQPKAAAHALEDIKRLLYASYRNSIGSPPEPRESSRST